jgi:hypothetical protein
VPVAALTFAAEGSLKGAPEVHTVLRLVDEILTDGFITGGEPLELVQDDRLDAVGAPLTSPWPGQLKPFSLGYSKGQARATTLLGILSVCRDKNIPIPEAFPMERVG